jgi:hypothetical protein
MHGRKQKRKLPMFVLATSKVHGGLTEDSHYSIKESHHSTEWTDCYDCHNQCIVDTEMLIVDSGTNVQLCYNCYKQCERQARTN